MSGLEIVWQEPTAEKNIALWRSFIGIAECFAPLTTKDGWKRRKASRDELVKALHVAIQKVHEADADDAGAAPAAGVAERILLDRQRKAQPPKEPVKAKRSRHLSSSSSSSSSSGSASSSSSSSSSSSGPEDKATSKPPRAGSSGVRPKEVESTNLKGLGVWKDSETYIMVDSRLGITEKNLTEEIIGAKNKVPTTMLLTNILRLHPRLWNINWADTKSVQLPKVGDVKDGIINWLLENEVLKKNKYIDHKSRESLMQAVRNMIKTAIKTKEKRALEGNKARKSASQGRIQKWTKWFVYL